MDLQVVVPAVLTMLTIWLVGRFWQWRKERAAHRRLMAHFEALEALSFALPKRAYSESELREYNGEEEGQPILLAADGRVFNVSRGYEFYGREGCYHALAGRDASRLLAKGILEAETEEQAAQPLQRYELATLSQWAEHYQTKQPERLEPHTGSRAGLTLCAQQVRAAWPSCCRPRGCMARRRRAGRPHEQRVRA